MGDSPRVPKRRKTVKKTMNVNDDSVIIVSDVQMDEPSPKVAKKRKILRKKKDLNNDNCIIVSDVEIDGASLSRSPKKRKVSAKQKVAKTTKTKKSKLTESETLENIDIENEELFKSWSDSGMLSELCNIPEWISENVIKLVKEENTLPFIARYRKAMIDNMPPDKLQVVFDQLENIQNLRKRAKTILSALTKANKLSPPLMKAVMFAKSISELELLYAPHKSQTGTLAERARKLGLEPAALKLMDSNNISISSLINPSVKELHNYDIVEEHIIHIIADVIYKDTRVLEYLRKLKLETVMSLQCCEAKSTKKNEEKFEENKEKYKLYLNYKNRVDNVKPHQVLAINRGETAKVLSVKVIIPDWYERQLTKFCTHIWRGSIISKAINDACNRLIKPWVNRQVRNELTTKAEDESISVFSDNLERFLLTEPVKNRNIMAIDPGFKAGCKIAIIGADSVVMNTFVMHPIFKSSNDQQAYKLKQQIDLHRCEVIALGNGTACRETEFWLKNHDIVRDIPLIIIPEQGASIYSCSPEALKEYPNMDPNLISAISLAKRVLDPLAELVKVEPKHLGVGLYQHDISGKKLSEALDNVVIRCVSMVGVDVNTASQALLRRVAGLSDSRAAAIIKYRSSNGGIKTRAEIIKVAGIGPKTFKQCAGFIKVQNGPESLDSTIIHPESYSMAKRLAKKFGLGIDNLGKENFVSHFRNILSNINISQLATEFKTDDGTVELIINAFKQMPHEDGLTLNKPIYSTTVKNSGQLVEGATVTGIVRNVTPFGCFVDCGVGRDGLVHSSKMNGNRWPKLGERVEVMISAIPNPQRIELLLKAII